MADLHEQLAQAAVRHHEARAHVESLEKQVRATTATVERITRDISAAKQQLATAESLRLMDARLFATPGGPIRRAIEAVNSARNECAIAEQEFGEYRLQQDVVWNEFGGARDRLVAATEQLSQLQVKLGEAIAREAMTNENIRIGEQYRAIIGTRLKQLEDDALPINARLGELKHRLQLARAQLEDAVSLLDRKSVEFEGQVYTDPLTALQNVRRYNEDIRKGGRYLALLDLDFFKQVNDSYGHPEGDAVLAAFGACLNQNLAGSSGRGYRVGGDEFAILFTLPIEPERVIETLEQIRASWDLLRPRCTFTSGISLTSPNISHDELIKAADKALYEAKEAGRNQTYYEQGGQFMPAREWRKSDQS